jgi:hypothetical protein
MGRLNRPGSNRTGMIMLNDQGRRCLRYAAVAPHGLSASNYGKLATLNRHVSDMPLFATELDLVKSISAGLS